MLQKALIIKTYLHYYDFKRQLYINLDKSKRYEFKIMLYYVFEDSQSNSFSKIDIQSIFLFKLFNVAEFRY